jgi:hypothetical protein
VVRARGFLKWLNFLAAPVSAAEDNYFPAAENKTRKPHTLLHVYSFISVRRFSTSRPEPFVTQAQSSAAACDICSPPACKLVLGAH